MTREFFKTPVLFSNKYCLLHKNLQRKINEAMRLGSPSPSQQTVLLFPV